jgi:hypothetical protein
MKTILRVALASCFVAATGAAQDHATGMSHHAANAPTAGGQYAFVTIA